MLAPVAGACGRRRDASAEHIAMLVIAWHGVKPPLVAMARGRYGAIVGGPGQADRHVAGLADRNGVGSR
ncbi:hypothetical protein [Rhodopila sp.]|uniref:hypothetical protein n=1 Tax=Rhodopila sp. TaxID=2480087 RepID=UPI003D0E7897